MDAGVALWRHRRYGRPDGPAAATIARPALICPRWHEAPLESSTAPTRIEQLEDLPLPRIFERAELIEQVVSRVEDPTALHDEIREVTDCRAPSGCSLEIDGGRANG